MIRRFRWWEPKYPNVHWTDSVTGYGIQVRFNDFTGTWCGYVVLPEDHPCLDPVDEDYSLLTSIPVHGGWTYRNGSVVGFDCAHYSDFRPTDTPSSIQKTYWTFAMVKDEILKAALALFALQ